MPNMTNPGPSRAAFSTRSGPPDVSDGIFPREDVSANAVPLLEPVSVGGGEPSTQEPQFHDRQGESMGCNALEMIRMAYGSPVAEDSAPALKRRISQDTGETSSPSAYSTQSSKKIRSSVEKEDQASPHEILDDADREEAISPSKLEDVDGNQSNRLIESEANSQDTGFLCRTCFKSFLTEEDLVRHKQQFRLELHPCTICWKQFNNSHALDVHDKLEHSENTSLAELVVKQEKERLECIVKGKARSLGARSPPATSLREELEKRKHALAKKNKCVLHICGLCPKVFKEGTECKSHQETEHSMKEPVYPCHYCLSVFTTKEGLTQHGISHWSPIYPCPACPKVFKEAGDAMYHAAKKHNITPGAALRAAPVGPDRNDAAAAAAGSSSSVSASIGTNDANVAGAAGLPEAARGLRLPRHRESCKRM